MYQRQEKLVKIMFGELKIEQPLTIYTEVGCNACKDVKKLCKNNNIAYTEYNRNLYKDKVNKMTGNYKYVPVIIDGKGRFIGGKPELEKIIKNI